MPLAAGARARALVSVVALRIFSLLWEVWSALSPVQSVEDRTCTVGLEAVPWFGGGVRPPPSVLGSFPRDQVLDVGVASCGWRPEIPARDVLRGGLAEYGNAVDGADARGSICHPL